MLSERLKKVVAAYPDFPKKGILFRDVSPVLLDPELLDELVAAIASYPFLLDTEGIVAIDARGFIFGSLLAYKLKKPLLIARKKNKLPGVLIEKEYKLEYGFDSLSIQKDSLKGMKKFVIVDDLLATGGTAKCVGDLLNSEGKEVLALIVIINLKFLKGEENLSFPVYSQLNY